MVYSFAIDNNRNRADYQELSSDASFERPTMPAIQNSRENLFRLKDNHPKTLYDSRTLLGKIYYELKQVEMEEVVDAHNKKYDWIPRRIP